MSTPPNPPEGDLAARGSADPARPVPTKGDAARHAYVTGLAATIAEAAAVAEQDRLRAEFAASGYTDAAAWRVDRKAGHLRTGEAAARRRWDITRGAYDVEETTRVVGCPTSSSARGLTCRKPRAAAETPP